MTEQAEIVETTEVEVSLIGAKTYGTLTRVYQQGEPFMASKALWETLSEEVNPATGVPMFCLTADLPAPPVTSSDITSEDLRMSGLAPEIDTGLVPVENTLDILNEGSTPELDENGEEFPKGAPDDTPPVDTPAAPTSKRLTIGGAKNKAVTV